MGDVMRNRFPRNIMLTADRATPEEESVITDAVKEVLAREGLPEQNALTYREMCIRDRDTGIQRGSRGGGRLLRGHRLFELPLPVRGPGGHSLRVGAVRLRLPCAQRESGVQGGFLRGLELCASADRSGQFCAAALYNRLEHPRSVASSGSVSYTHLDVYKRQPQTW